MQHKSNNYHHRHQHRRRSKGDDDSGGSGAGVNHDDDDSDSSESDSETPSTASRKFTSDEMVEILQENATLRKRVEELEGKIQRTEDLNLFMPYITQFYQEVFRTLRRDFLDNHGRVGLVDWLYRDWVELFNAALLEQDDFDKKVIKSRPLNESIDKCMLRLANISRPEWNALQNIRKERNCASHPRLDATEASKALNRWNSDPAGLVLKKVLRSQIPPSRSAARSWRPV